MLQIPTTIYQKQTCDVGLAFNSTGDDAVGLKQKNFKMQKRLTQQPFNLFGHILESQHQKRLSQSKGKS